MKKLLAIILCCVLAFSVAACSSGNTDSTEPEQTASQTVSDEKLQKITDKLADFEGIVYLTQNGSVVYSQAKGTDEKGNELTIETPTYIGSVSKQFCATAIMMLKEQGKLSVDDTIDKYFPEYERGKDITIKNLLSMRSGIPEMLSSAQGYSSDKTDSENTAIIMEWAFDQPLNFDPDSKFEYSNTNYFLLGNIVEIVSNKSYNDFIRENIFVPLNMDNTGFITEVKDNEMYSRSLTYDTFAFSDEADGVAKGAGNIVSTAPDMDKWMTGLLSGEIISDESYREMIEDYSPDMGQQYGYGMMGMYKKGKGHTGSIGSYVSIDYINEEYGYNLFAVTTKSHAQINNMPTLLMDVLL